MTKKLTLILLSSIICFSFVSVSMASSEGNKRKGKYTYRKVYKKCHARGEVASAKPILNPDAKTQDQWQRAFDKEKFEEFKCGEEWASLSEKDLMDIFAYLHAHAADSPTPAKCKP